MKRFLCFLSLIFSIDSGVDGGTWTHGPQGHNLVLYQLSYIHHVKEDVTKHTVFTVKNQSCVKSKKAFFVRVDQKGWIALIDLRLQVFLNMKKQGQKDRLYVIAVWQYIDLALYS